MDLNGRAAGARSAIAEAVEGLILDVDELLIEVISPLRISRLEDVASDDQRDCDRASTKARRRLLDGGSWISEHVVDDGVIPIHRLMRLPLTRRCRRQIMGSRRRTRQI